jgi:hypothetical protein
VCSTPGPTPHLIYRGAGRASLARSPVTLDRNALVQLQRRDEPRGSARGSSVSWAPTAPADRGATDRAAAPADDLCCEQVAEVTERARWPRRAGPASPTVRAGRPSARTSTPSAIAVRLPAQPSSFWRGAQCRRAWGKGVRELDGGDRHPDPGCRGVRRSVLLGSAGGGARSAHEDRRWPLLAEGGPSPIRRLFRHGSCEWKDIDFIRQSTHTMTMGCAHSARRRVSRSRERRDVGSAW